MKVKYIGKKDTLAFKREKTYKVIGIEDDFIRVMTELDEDYLFEPECFKIVEGGPLDVKVVKK